VLAAAVTLVGAPPGTCTLAFALPGCPTHKLQGGLPPCLPAQHTRPLPDCPCPSLPPGGPGCRSDLCSPAILKLCPGGSKASLLLSPPVPVHRSHGDLASCPVDAWAPRHGPVRPILQLMCVLPVGSAGAALPAPLADLMAVAQAADDPLADASSSERQAADLRAATHQVRGSNPPAAGQLPTSC